MSEELLFEAALKAPAAERGALLDRACAGQPELRERLERLLAAHAQPADWLAGQATGAFIPSDAPPAATAPYLPDTQAGQVIAGKYKLLQQIGEGGMGSVWMADQTEPVKRRVAVKLIRAERGQSKTILSRFEAERQAIALMDHPNIAKLLDAGETPPAHTGGSPTPFFVMELVKGVPLNEFCDARKLSILERLGLFMQICSAVQHAHQKGIIHRDLKPSNILVESHDGKPAPKVIDFGLAKATTGMQLSEHTLFTGFGSVMGTPLYMAPEQADFNAVDVDTRADIHALGVILYELLTGTTPISRETIKKAALDEMLRLIREQEAPTPSSRLSMSESKPSVAANRQTEPVKLGRFVKGELDWIVLKALSKERDRRYETANGFAKDIERFLNHEPVTAGPPTAAYRLRKFVRRNRGQVIAASLVVLALLTGMAGTALGMIEAKRQEALARAEAKAKDDALQAEAEERKKAGAAKLEAQAREAEANAVVRFFVDRVFAAARPKGQEGGLGAGVTLRDAVVASVPALAKGFAGQPVVEGRLRLALGETFIHLGEHVQAAEQLTRARSLLTQHLGAEHADTLACVGNLATNHGMSGRHAEALPLFEEVLAVRRRVLPPDHPDTLSNLSNLALCHQALDRPNDALRLYEAALAGQRRALSPDHPDTLSSMGNLALCYQDLGRHADARKLMEETLAIQKRTLPQDHPDVLKSMQNLAVSLALENRHAAALQLLEETLAIRKRVLPKGHPNTLSSMAGVAKCHMSMNRFAQALVLFEEVLALQERALPRDHPDTLMAMNNLAHCYMAENRLAEAIQLNEKILAIQRQVLPKDHRDTLFAMSRSAHCLMLANRPVDALKLSQEALAGQKRSLPDGHPSSLINMLQLANILVELGRGAEAIPHLDEFLAKAPAGPAVSRGLIPSALSLRMGHFRKVGDAAGCRSTAEMGEQLNRANAESLYNAACQRAITASVQAKVPGADAARLAQDDAARAMQLLRETMKSGLASVARLKNDADLDFLRDREDFKRLLAELEAKAEKK